MNVTAFELLALLGLWNMAMGTIGVLFAAFEDEEHDAKMSFAHLGLGYVLVLVASIGFMQ